MAQIDYDVVIVGGGFYGACLALYFRACKQSVCILESSETLLGRASYANQARVHNGYHYPRSLITGIRSSVNFPRFVRDFGYSINRDFTKLYAVAKRGSKVSANQFYQFCHKIGAPVEQASAAVVDLFDPDLIEAVFKTQEYAFDAEKLRTGLLRRLQRAQVEVKTGREAVLVEPLGSRDGVRLRLSDGSVLAAQHALNCTYAHINTLLKRSDLPMLAMKHEIAELALVSPAPKLRNYGMTVMDGPFFSTMPFPAAKLFSFSHVRFTPHFSWSDSLASATPDQVLKRHRPASQFAPMVRDAARFVPALRETQYVSSLFEIKTVLLDNEDNDGRPILLRRNYGMPNFSVVMGGKIDNIYDIFAALDEFSPRPNATDPEQFIKGIFH